MKYNTIIWDWNGTLLNDRWLAIEVMNSLLNKRFLPLLTDEKYLEVFDFPVKDYYAKLGFNFDKEPFEIVGKEFIVEYDNRHLECTLHKNVSELLKQFKNKGIKQYILSARNHRQLQEELDYFRINGYFESISGLSDDYANGKTELGRRLIEAEEIDQNKTVLIGDTVHDFEVAEELNIDCILIEGGHHSIERLKKCNTIVVSSLLNLVEMLNR